jgi:hypothetical protein
MGLGDNGSTFSSFLMSVMKQTLVLFEVLLVLVV